jgi:glucosyl-3-phosphoglycerate synthase
LAVQKQAVTRSPVADWFSRRCYEHDSFGAPATLARRKRELGLSLSIVLPCREVAGTIGAIADEIHALNEEAPLVDEVVAIDARSSDGTADVARRHGLSVYVEDELVPGFGPALGKGDAMWRALAVARGDLVMYLDSDTSNFGRHYVYGMLGPILTEPAVTFVKATYHRPFLGPDGAVLDEAGRVTELTAKPLLRLFYPELSGFGQPLSGELVAYRGLLDGLCGRSRHADRHLQDGGPRSHGPGGPRRPPQPLPVAARSRSDVLRGRHRGGPALARGRAPGVEQRARAGRAVVRARRLHA